MSTARLIALRFGRIAICAGAISAAGATTATAQSPAIDPMAVQGLQRTLTQLYNANQMRVHTVSTVEDLDAAGHRIDRDLTADIIIKRPNGLLTVRSSEGKDGRLYYDGKTLTLFDQLHNVYASKPAPPTIEGMITLARERVGIVMPAADLLYRDAFAQLTKDMSLAKVVGTQVIGGVKCDHLLFSRPGADFQVCVASGPAPWPVKYIVTDTSTPARLSVSTEFTKWDTAAKTDPATFEFVPPPGAQLTKFVPVKPADGADR